MKCENCGANLKADRRTQFCPYCGEAVMLPGMDREMEIDFEKYKLNHAETVRKRVDRSDAIRTILIIILMIVIPFLAVIPLSFFDEDARMDRMASEVQQLILDGDYETASVKVETIRVEKKSLIDDHYNKYEALRNDLKKLIEQKKRESGK